MARMPVYMPKYGMTMTEGLIVEWLHKEGDAVQQGDPLLTVETEKASAEIESPASGILVDVRFQVDDVVPVGEIVAYLETGS